VLDEDFFCEAVGRTWSGNWEIEFAARYEGTWLYLSAKRQGSSGRTGYNEWKIREGGVIFGINGNSLVF
jgi:hypothetical protein